MAKQKAQNPKKQKRTQKRNDKSSKKQQPKPRPPAGMRLERFDRLVAESLAPYKGLRKFIYASIGASGAIGGFVFFTKVLAGRDVAASLPNLALQVGIVALMVFLFRWEDHNKQEAD